MATAVPLCHEPTLSLSAEAPQLSLVLLRGPPQCHRRISLAFNSSNRIVVGRGLDCDVVLDPWLVFASATHAAITREPSTSDQHEEKKAKKSVKEEEGQYFITDLGSRNGTVVNKKRLCSGVPTSLSHGDTIIFGGMKDIEEGKTIDPAALQREELVVWRVETLSGARDEARLFEMEKDRSTGAAVEGVDELFEKEEPFFTPTNLRATPSEAQLDRYAAYILRAALGSRGEARDAAEAEGGDEIRSSRPTVSLHTAVVVDAEKEAPPSPVSVVAAAPAVECELPVEENDEKSEERHEEIQKVEDERQPLGIEAAAAATPRSRLKPFPPSAAASLPFFLRYAEVRVGKWRWSVPGLPISSEGSSEPSSGRFVSAPSTLSTADQAAEAVGPRSSKRRKRARPAAFLPPPVPAASASPPDPLLCFSLSHWRWSVVGDGSEDKSRSAASVCLLPVASIGSWFYCVKGVQGVAVELRAGVQQLAGGDVPPEIIAAPPEAEGSASSHPNRWIVWAAMDEHGPESGQDAESEEKGERRKEKAFEDWIASVSHYYHGTGLPEPVEVDAEAFQIILDPPTDE